VDVPSEAIPSALADPDDNVVLACAMLGQADYVVTHDEHFERLIEKGVLGRIESRP